MFKPEIFIVSTVEEILAQTAGENSKGVMVIAQTGEGMNTGDPGLLNKILHSVQLDSTKDVLLLEAESTLRFSLAAVCKASGSHTVLVFGCTPSQLGMQFRIEKYLPFSINGIKGVWADPLHELENAREKKNALWKAMQTLFQS